MPKPKSGVNSSVRSETSRVVPVSPDGEQELMRFARREEDVTRASLGRVAFVPLLGGKG